MKKLITFLMCAFLVALPAMAGGPKKGTKKGTPPGLAKNQGVPPGLAKKGGLPPGLAKKFGVKLPAIAFIAIDPKFHDRAWFLIDDTWVQKTGFDTPLRLEVRDALKLPSVPPPIPLPKLRDPLHVISFK
jgi:hypothetical protein